MQQQRAACRARSTTCLLLLPARSCRRGGTSAPASQAGVAAAAPTIHAVPATCQASWLPLPCRRIKAAGAAGSPRGCDRRWLPLRIQAAFTTNGLQPRCQTGGRAQP